MDKFAEYVVDVASAFQKMYRVIIGHGIKLDPSKYLYEKDGEERENDNLFKSGYQHICNSGYNYIEVGVDLHANPRDHYFDDQAFIQSHDTGVDIRITYETLGGNAKVDCADIMFDPESKTYELDCWTCVDMDVNKLMKHFRATLIEVQPSNNLIEVHPREHYKLEKLSESQALEILSALCVIYNKRRALNQAAT